MSKPACIAATAFAAISLAACGGSSSPSPAASIDLADINASNASTVASVVVKAAYQGGEFGSFANVFGAIGSTTVTKAENLYSKIGEIQLTHTGTMLKASQIGVFQAPLQEIESPCDTEGVSILSGNVQSLNTLTINDVLTIEYINCNDGVTIVDGTISMRILAFSGDFSGGSVSFSVAVTLDDFAVTADGETETANGDITVALSLPNSGALSMSISSQEFTVDDGTSSNSLQAFSLTQTIDPLTTGYTMIVSGTIGSSAFDGVVEFTTSAALTGTGEDFAATGELIITGDGNATIAVFALDATMVRLEIDFDGDGEADQITDATWAELTAG